MNDKHMAKVLVAIPVFNEVKYVEDVLREIARYAENVLVIDDGSRDGTVEVLKKQEGLEIRFHARNEGYGQTLIDAFNVASQQEYDWVITIDCDFQHEPSCLPRFYSEIAKDDCDVISGSRYLKPPRDSSSFLPADRVLINRKVTDILNRSLGVKLTDSFCGFKAYRVKAMSKLTLTEKGYGFPLQFWVRAIRCGLRIREIPVPLIYIDPNRCFGGDLDNASVRMKHYAAIIERELRHDVGKDTAGSICSQG